MAHVIIAEGLANESFIAERTEGYELLVEAVKDWTPEGNYYGHETCHYF
jgi:formate dehydrogenase major subunit